MKVKESENESPTPRDLITSLGLEGINHQIWEQSNSVYLRADDGAFKIFGVNVVTFSGIIESI